MCMKSRRTSGRLRVTQAYIALSGIPGCDPAPRTLTVERIGAYEIRMFRVASIRSGDATLLWMELFDHVTRRSLNSCSFREIEEALSAFDTLSSQVNI